MRKSVTISLPVRLSKLLDRVALEEGTSRSEIVRDALSRQLALREFRKLRARLVPKARARGIQTDEDVFKIVS